MEITIFRLALRIRTLGLVCCAVQVLKRLMESSNESKVINSGVETTFEKNCPTIVPVDSQFRAKSRRLSRRGEPASVSLTCVPFLPMSQLGVTLLCGLNDKCASYDCVYQRCLIRVLLPVKLVCA